jgi:uncharacterized membrane protein
MKNKLGFVLAFVFLVFTISLMTVRADTWPETSQPDINWMKVYVKGEQVFEGRCDFNSTSPVNAWECKTQDQFQMPSIERGENVDVKVVFEGGSTTPIDRADVHVWFRASGDTIEDQTGVFDIYSGNTYTRTLYLKIPSTLDVKENPPKVYTIHVEIEADNTLSGISKADVTFDVQRLSDELAIKSVNLRTNCGTVCSTVYADVVVKNTGNHDLEDVYVRATIKELGVSGTSYVDLLVPYRTTNDDEDTSREVSIALTLPQNVQAGTYTIEIDAYNDETETIMTQQFVISSGTAASSVEITPQTVRQDIVQGGSGTFTLIVTNKGTSTQTFSVETTGLEGWATSQITPAAFSLAPGESKLVTVYLSTKEDVISAEHLFSVEVGYGQESKTFNFVANVTGQKTTLDLKTTLMIVGIVLAVAIIILLIVLLAQKTRTEEKTEESYY